MKRLFGALVCVLVFASMGWAAPPKIFGATVAKVYGVAASKVHGVTGATGEPTPNLILSLDDNAANTTVDDSIGANDGKSATGNTSVYHSATGCTEGTGCFKFTAVSDRVYVAGAGIASWFTDSVFSVEFNIYGDNSGTGTFRNFIHDSASFIIVKRYDDDTHIICSMKNGDYVFAVDDMDNSQWNKFRVVVDINAAAGSRIRLFQRVGTGAWAEKSRSRAADEFDTNTAFGSIITFYNSTGNDRGWYSSTGDYKVDEVKIWADAVPPL